MINVCENYIGQMNPPKVEKPSPALAARSPPQNQVDHRQADQYSQPNLQDMLYQINAMSETRHGSNGANLTPQEQNFGNPLELMKQALSEKRVPQMHHTHANTTVGGNALNGSSMVQSAGSNHFMNFQSNDQPSSFNVSLGRSSNQYLMRPNNMPILPDISQVPNSGAQLQSPGGSQRNTGQRRQVLGGRSRQGKREYQYVKFNNLND